MTAAEPVDDAAPVRATIVSNEPEADLACGLLRDAGIACMHRITDFAFGSGGEIPTSGAGPREVLVRRPDLELAREVLGLRATGADPDPINR